MAFWWLIIEQLTTFHLQTFIPTYFLSNPEKSSKCSAFLCICNPVPYLIIRLFNSPNNSWHVLEIPGFKVVSAICNEQRKKNALFTLKKKIKKNQTFKSYTIIMYWKMISPSVSLTSKCQLIMGFSAMAWLNRKLPLWSNITSNLSCTQTWAIL